MGLIRPLFVGFATTLKYLFSKPITVNYPRKSSDVSEMARESRC
jgi:formate hydrogenlyase subunit 6/NADH:ubiquinone oxidoreductase subunit I